MSDLIDKLVGKILDGQGMEEADTYDDRGGTRQKIDARSEPRDEPEKPMNYRDWLKKQPKPKSIGIHKTKK